MTTTESGCERLAQTLGLPIQANLSGYQASPAFVLQFPIAYARQHHVLGLVADTGVDQKETTHLAICDESGWHQLDHLSRCLRRHLQPLIVARETILALINTGYADRDTKAHEVLQSMDAASLASEISLRSEREDLLDVDKRAPVIQLVNQLIFDAVVAGASDIHIQPAEGHVTVRYRVDGVLFDVFEIPKVIQEEVLTRVKVMGKMNIAEKRLPQDGRASVQMGEREVDLRIASMPTSHNERIVIRLLDKSVRLYTLEELGMDAHTLSRWRELIRVDHGLILVTGPTGSGKSTTLYGALQEINSAERNILTLEDPIEYQLDGISQTQINEKKGMTFASGMRSVLRQDPDIIMIGEIRDADTANMAIQASLTGHLVFSTLHTNDAASAVTRLLDLGVEPYLVSSSLVASLAQRLVRRLCSECQSTEGGPSESSPAVGCESCRGSGYRGRVGLFELLVMNEETRQLVQQRANATTLRDSAMKAGMTLLIDDGRQKVDAGQTTLEEVHRVTTAGE